MDCEKSTDEVYISEILKQSGVRVFKIEEIKNLIANDKIEEALNLLRGRYDKDDDVILLMSRLAAFDKADMRGLHLKPEADATYNKLVTDVLKLLAQLEKYE